MVDQVRERIRGEDRGRRLEDQQEERRHERPALAPHETPQETTGSRGFAPGSPTTINATAGPRREVDRLDPVRVVSSPRDGLP
jgi:hypothetical protein